MGIAFVFSGQGAQYSKMGKELYDRFPICKAVFDEADDALGFRITDICFDEANVEQLNNTEFCQPAILTLSTACYRLLAQEGIQAEVMAGLSLGEYSALTNAGVFEFADAVRLVNKRGRFMSEAVPVGQGAMSAILGLEAEAVEKACANALGYAVCANYNAPGQIVIAGELNAVAEAEKLAQAYGAKRAIRLAVSGPFHTRLLDPAVEKLKAELEKITISDPRTPVISNVDSFVIERKEDIIPTLLKQIVSPVRWENGVRFMLNRGVDTFVEIGPGKTLLGFIKKVQKDVQLYHMEDIKSYEEVLQIKKGKSLS